MNTFVEITEVIADSLTAADIDFDHHQVLVDQEATFTVPMVGKLVVWTFDRQPRIAVELFGSESYRVTFTEDTPLEVIGHAATGIALHLIVTAR